MIMFTFITAALFIAGLICFAAFVWGVKAHFRRTEKIPAGTKLISMLSAAGYLAFAIHLAFGAPGGLWYVALALFVLSLALFAWTVSSTRRTPPTLAFDDDAPSFLLRHGPYQYVRHPFYLSYLLYWTGTACAFSGILPWAAPVVMGIVYARAASREEGKFARSELAMAYDAYRRRAGMFLPRVGALVMQTSS
jgi:protein-S-isoprenylcysteine O-methyltransferase Ste14